jgi:hypothetical protein
MLFNLFSTKIINFFQVGNNLTDTGYPVHQLPVTHHAFSFQRLSVLATASDYVLLIFPS